MRGYGAALVVAAAMGTLVWSGEMHESTEGQDATGIRSGDVSGLPVITGSALPSLPTLSEAQVVTLDESVLAAREELAVAIIDADVIEEEPYVPAAPREVVSLRVSGGGWHDVAYAAMLLHFPGQADYAYSVAMCETGGTMNPASVGALYEQGIFQVRAIYHGPVPADIEGQVAQAARIVARSGWFPWSCR